MILLRSNGGGEGIAACESYCCTDCSSKRLWKHGSYSRKALVTALGGTALTVRRVRCMECGRTHSLIPGFAASGLRAEDAVVERAATTYLADPAATCRAVAGFSGVAHATIHRWLTKLGRVAVAGLFAAVIALRPSLDLVATLPKLVAAEERKAKSPERVELLRSAQQALVAGRLLAEDRHRGLADARPPTIATILRHPT